MVSPGEVPISLLSILLLIGPGLIGLDLYFRFSGKNSSLSRLQLVVYSAAVSVASILLLYLTTPIYFPLLSSASNDVASQLGIITESELSQLKIPNIISLYLFHFFLAGIFGAGMGYAANERSDKELDRRDAWQYAFEAVPEDGEQIEVVMEDNTTIQGQFNEKAWDADQRELFLEDPSEVEYEENGSSIDHCHDLGRSILLKEEAISRIVFTKDDPQSEMDPEDAETDSGSEETQQRITIEVDSLEAKTALEEVSPQDDMEISEEIQSSSDENSPEDR